MDASQKWKTTLKSENFRRKVHMYINNATGLEQAHNLQFTSTFPVVMVPEPEPEPATESADEESNYGSSVTASQDNSFGDYSPDDSDAEWKLLCDTPHQDINKEEATEQSGHEENLASFLRNWSLQYNISQQALKPLLQRLNNYERTLPESPRQLLRTPRIVPDIIDIEGGQYWHQGLGKLYYIITRYTKK